MTIRNSLSVTLEGATILHRVKEAYLIWISIVPHISKTARFTIGSRIEHKLIDLLEQSYTTYFSEKDNKLKKIDECILTVDTLKFLTTIAWEGKIISNKHYEEIAAKLEEVGKMLGGWRKRMETPVKKNPA